MDLLMLFMSQDLGMMVANSENQFYKAAATLH